MTTASPSFWNVLKIRWRDTRSRKGVVATVREISSDLSQFLKECLPERRRSLYGDAEYDWEHQANTTSGGVSQRTRLLAAISGAPYQPTEPELFSDMMSALVLDYGNFTFIDLGSGKGRTLLMAVGLGFRRAIGVELLPELHQIAQSNVAHLPNVEVVCMDARDFEFPNEPLVLYLFNPLPATALESVVQKLSRLKSPLRVIYHNPVAEDVLSQAAFLSKSWSTHQYVIYSN